MQKIMIVEDDPKIAEHLHTYLDKYGYEVAEATEWEDITAEFQKYQPDLVLLDINLPKFDGFYWCRQIRNLSLCPIIFLSARTGGMDQVMAIENGGDDYITKPFAPEVVVAKVRGQLRRAYGEYAVTREKVWDQGGVELFPERMELHFEGEQVTLTKKETDVLEVLFDRYPRVAGREDLLEKLWEEQAFVDENTLNVNITRARKKLQQLGIEHAIETVRGAGYRLVATWEHGE
ncbi:response regulator transcription factor [Salimicrobium halophilum]|uniref:DNA-binding response regulator, OmpR family, contains REC and winged-helix (WHTH) domain n=1 Tax=Salimicrobium halophilum TaxID=86666 RepID=A0A1G8UR78_9BACI|nr:response regulator transcription factor [Salimicrobium halophilum]SDJ56386.1 DNA-binding response regulator, OmpR family, contains REC and winged-helix (wHTH) domain [Salimicrobium halophilum]